MICYCYNTNYEYNEYVYNLFKSWNCKIEFDEEYYEREENEREENEREESKEKYLPILKLLHPVKL